MKEGYAKLIKLPEGAYHRCARCGDVIGQPCPECAFVNGAVLVKTPDASLPQANSTLNLGQALIMLSLVGLIYLSYLSLESSASSRAALTLFDLLAIMVISAIVIGLVMGFLKLIRR